MAKTVAIIGSFQKYYDDITQIIELFNQNGIMVNSPANSSIVDRYGDFVILGTDDRNLSDVDIEMVTLDKILKADFVYVYNPNGYVGKTTCYELGACVIKGKPLFYLEKPHDLPIPVNDEQILQPNAFAEYVKANEPVVQRYLSMNRVALSAYNGLESKHEHREKKLDCVILGAYDRNLSDVNSEMVILDRIHKANFLYVYNPNGFVGNTTCYELGVCIIRGKPLFYLEKPHDLPIPVNDEQILQPNAFAEYVNAHEPVVQMYPSMSQVAIDAYNHLRILGKDSRSDTSAPNMSGSHFSWDDPEM